MSELIFESAASLVAAMRRGKLSAVELMNACYDQIERVNPTLNAIVNLLPRDRAVALAREADRAQAAGARLGPLHGLPMAPKDCVEVEDFPTTWGFVPFRDRIARADDELAARQRAAGALFIGKTNMPELGLGSHTFNRLFGTTRNPHDPTRSAGGSSGGAAAALAAGLLPLADGTDMGGSLRNPASFCNVVGLRPSIGRVPAAQRMGWLARLSTPGPMARTVADAALLLSVQAGPYPPDPLTLAQPGHAFAGTLARDFHGLRIAWTPDLGFLPVEPEVARVVEAAAQVFRGFGCVVEPACPDLTDAMAVFQVERAAAMAVLGRELDRTVPDWRRHAKDTLLWNVEQGFALTSEALLDAEVRRTRIYREAVEFFSRYDALLLPAAQVAPFPVEQEWVREIDGRPMQTYIDWMSVCCAISVTGLPALSVPAGFTPAGLPVGLQIVAGPHDDLGLLQLAHEFEQATLCHRRRPVLALEGTASTG
ncbi:MAG TPA: amidase [Pseudomonadales bacterium]